MGRFGKVLWAGMVVAGLVVLSPSVQAGSAENPAILSLSPALHGGFAASNLLALDISALRPSKGNAAPDDPGMHKGSLRSGLEPIDFRKSIDGNSIAVSLSAGNNYFEYQQDGGLNDVTAVIKGQNNQTSIVQFNGNNSAYVSQNGIGNSVSLRQISW